MVYRNILFTGLSVSHLSPCTSLGESIGGVGIREGTKTSLSCDPLLVLPCCSLQMTQKYHVCVVVFKTLKQGSKEMELQFG